jgi:2,4-dienoyl-CoA reductase (NADPH2)
MACNRISDPLLADQILRDGQADLIGLARGLIADPELPNKASQGRFDEINRCIACNQGVCPIFSEAGDLPGQRPAARRQSTSARPRKKVMVIGGGPGKPRRRAAPPRPQRCLPRREETARLAAIPSRGDSDFWGTRNLTEN